MDDPVAALEALTSLRDRGLITEEEFAARRPAILARLDGPPRQVDAAADNLSSAPATRGATPIAPIAMIVGGVLYAVGSALPWISATAAFVGTVTRSGLEGGDGIITIGLGLLVAFVGLAFLTGSKASGSKLSAILVALVALGFAVWKIGNINDRIDSFDTEFGVAYVGIGLWLMVAGAVVAALGAMSLRPKSRTGTNP